MLGSRTARTVGDGDAAPGTLGPEGPLSRAHGGEQTSAGRAGFRLSRLVSWKQSPCRTSALFAAANTVIGFVAFSSFRAYSLLAILLALLVVMATAGDLVGSRSTGTQLWRSMTASFLAQVKRSSPKP